MYTLSLNYSKNIVQKHTFQPSQRGLNRIYLVHAVHSVHTYALCTSFFSFTIGLRSYCIAKTFHKSRRRPKLKKSKIAVVRTEPKRNYMQYDNILTSSRKKCFFNLSIMFGLWPLKCLNSDLQKCLNSGLQKLLNTALQNCLHGLLSQ